jgi:hypothetical protein
MFTLDFQWLALSTATCGTSACHRGKNSAITADALKWNLVTQIPVLQRDEIRGNAKVSADGLYGHFLSAFNELGLREIALAQNVAGMQQPIRRE